MTTSGGSSGRLPAHALRYFNNGGTLAYVVRIGGDGDAVAAPSPVAEISAKGGAATLKALPKPGAPDGISVNVTAGDDDSFTITVRGGGTEEKFEGLTLSKGAKNALDVVNKTSTLVQLEELKVAGLSIAERAPAPGTYPLALPSATTTAVVAVTPSDYEGDVGDRDGLGGLEAVDEITMVVAPDAMAAFQAESSTWTA